MQRILLTGLLLVLAWVPAAAYSVLTHQANIDSTWEPCLVPTLQRRFPGATPAELKEAKAYAYGGAIIQDMGFYPFGSKLFTNLTHYVRSGDFVRNLLDEAHNRNEYAFALGALGHYAADISGHPEGTNKALAFVYPQLKAEFGEVITYHEAPKQHTQLEFSFDVLQVAAGRYRSDDYHNYIGFKVSKEVLERAFEKTYSLKLGQVIANVDLSISSYRFAVKEIIPMATRAAWQSKKKDILAISPKARRRDYIYDISRRQYRKEFGGSYQQPGFGARVLSYLVRVLPKVGPLKPFAFKLPTPEAQKLFRSSFHQVIGTYCGLLNKQGYLTAAALPNTDFDTGHITRTGEYPLADETYSEWLLKLNNNKFEGLTAPQKKSILAFYTPAEGKTNPPLNEDKQRQTQEALDHLRTLVTKEE
ncbi:zinc dependent phospholipase C family protein [Hymenobacter sp. DG25A]|uniref:zinc dependent phospholipase C family protein n=1 Tax=Hymenobacter sp. DG25A TaxID=1385663 RepID=UPI0006BCB831|nr:zinc dependent phospholipase C family protein [Hymenobacter sp. DG25A]ALD21494.1 hypothetical protein AM218_10070 [Hymenobacter sp. DG25A]